MKSKKRLLLVGKNSSIANSFMSHGKFIRYHVLSTSKDRDSSCYLDLSKTFIPDRLNTGVFDCGVVFAGMTKIDDCESKKSLSTQINCLSVLNLIENIDCHHWIIFSSAAVFDGTIPLCSVNQPFCPSSHYGKTKMSLEKGVEKLKKKVTILRITKVINKNFQFFINTLKMISEGKDVGVYSNIHIAPIWENTLSDLIYRIFEEQVYGLIQLSACDDISYYDAVLYCAEKLGLDTGLVHPLVGQSEGNRFASLLTNETGQLLEYALPKSRQVLDQFLANYSV